MAARNDVTGQEIKSRPLTAEYSANWDAIFKKKEITVVEEEKVIEDNEDSSGQ